MNKICARAAFKQQAGWMDILVNARTLNAAEDGLNKWNMRSDVDCYETKYSRYREQDELSDTNGWHVSFITALHITTREEMFPSLGLT